MRARAKPMLVVIAVLLAVGGLAWWLGTRGPGDPFVKAPTFADAGSAERVILPNPEGQLFKPLSPTDALLENAQIPFSDAPIEAANPLTISGEDIQLAERRSALDCLTAAVYYEAGFEPAQGKRGVAQVVLNRVRHPAFPNSICGVVYQGSERRTGCQFTFTCDGSLDRPPVPLAWERAREVASGAMSGAVEQSVGMATHYHADYVVPYWASSLSKITKLGSHYFYRWTGNWGRRSAFTQTLSFAPTGDTVPFISGTLETAADALSSPPLETDQPPPLPSPIIADALGGTLAEAERVEVPGDLSPLPDVAPIVADEAAGALLIDDQVGTLRGE